MDQKEIIIEKLLILRLEMSILNDRMKNVLDSVWKIRRLCLTLWLAGMGSIGIGR